MKYKLGDAINTSLLPCKECGNRHAETVVKINPLMTSWAFDGGKGHPLMEVNERIYIQEQRDLINRLLKDKRHLQSQVFKLKKRLS